MGFFLLELEEKPNFLCVYIYLYSRDSVQNENAHVERLVKNTHLYSHLNHCSVGQGVWCFF